MGTDHAQAIVLAGGRGTRMGGTAKPLLRIGGRTLLDLALDALATASPVVVVGPAELLLPPGVLRTREEPSFSGPAAAIAAGLAALRAHARPETPTTWVLAADQPGVAGIVAALGGGRDHVAAEAAEAGDGVIGVDPGGRRQPLAALYRTTALAAAVDRAAAGPGLAGLSMHELIGGLDLVAVSLPKDVAGDVDTWDDAARWGARLADGP